MAGELAAPLNIALVAPGSTTIRSLFPGSNTAVTVCVSKCEMPTRHEEQQ